MKTYELSLTSNYVMDWDFSMAVREIIQNGTDQEILDTSNHFIIKYQNGILRFINTKSQLKINTLLLGRSSKANNEDTVGHFGEGYKIAALVLNRLGKSFTIYNNARNEVWNSRFVNSRRWHDKILVFDIEEHKSDETALIIEVGNVTEEEYNNLACSWLGFLSDYKKIDTTYGEILLDSEQRNKVYVNGLFISCNAELQYGYNFKPAYLKLERDRKSCDSFDAKKLTSQMLSEAFDNQKISGSDICELIEDEVDDVSIMPYLTDNENISNTLIEHLEKKHQEGKMVVPVMNDSEYNKVKRYGGQPVMVNWNFGRLVLPESKKRISELINNPQNTQREVTIKEKLTFWFDEYGDVLSYTAKEKFTEILNEL